jgi:hypothetical protein
MLGVKNSQADERKATLIALRLLLRSRERKPSCLLSRLWISHDDIPHFAVTLKYADHPLKECPTCCSVDTSTVAESIDRFLIDIMR